MGKTNVLLKDKMRILLGKSVDVTELLQDYFRLAVKMKKKTVERTWVVFSVSRHPSVAERLSSRNRLRDVY